MFRILFAIAEFYSQARHYSRIDPGHLPTSPQEADRLVASHRRIVFVGKCFGLLGVATGLALTVTTVWAGVTEPRLAGDPHRPKDVIGGVFMILMAPVLIGIVGVVFGATIACAFASEEFYASPLGRKWLEMVGVRTTGPARFVCLLVAAIIAGVAALIGYFSLTDPR